MWLTCFNKNWSCYEKKFTRTKRKLCWCVPFRWQLDFRLGGWKFNNYVKFYGEKVELNNPKQQYLKYNEIQSYWYNFMVVKLSMAVLKNQQGLVFQKPQSHVFNDNSATHNSQHRMITLQCTLLADFLSLSDTFDEHSLLRHHESEPSTASKETSTHRSRIMSNSSHAPPEYVFNYLCEWMLITTWCFGNHFECIVWPKYFGFILFIC